jgi:hypothetical protein
MIIEALRDYAIHDNGLGQWKFTFQTDKETGEAEHVFPRELPPGYTLVAKWTGPRTVEIEPVLVDPVAAEKAVKSGEQSLDALSDADLMTKCAENSIKYNAKKFDRFTALTQLKDKIADPRKQLAGAGV